MPLVKAKIRVGYSPEPDQAFMLYAIVSRKIKTVMLVQNERRQFRQHHRFRSFLAQLQVARLVRLGLHHDLVGGVQTSEVRLAPLPLLGQLAAA